jgi:hypothetical protein
MRRGFTLIQISILLTVAALAMVSMLPSSQTNLVNNNATATKLNTILTAMRGYEAVNASLPCPADATQPVGGSYYGIEAANSGTTNNCGGGTPAANLIDSTNNVAIGMVPVRTLGLSNDYALDSFGRDITYAVDTNATTCFTGSLSGQITVTDNGTATSAVAALVSHGADGHGAWLPLTGYSGAGVRLNAGATDANELTNAHVNSSFVTTLPYTNFVRMPPTSTFDDIVVYSSPLWNLKNTPAAASGMLPSMTSQPSNGSYYTGQTLSFTLTFGSSVTVTGTPRLDLTIGSNTRYATYQSGSGTTALVFSYTIVGTDYAPSGISVASAIDLNGGSISPGCTTFTAPSLTGVLVNNFVLWVADMLNNRVEEFNAAGTYLTQIGCASGACSYCGPLCGPQSVNANSSGSLYIMDYHVMSVWNASGSYVSGPGSLTCTSGSVTTYNEGACNWSGATVNSSGSFWVADVGNNRVMGYNASGSYLGGSGTYAATIPYHGGSGTFCKMPRKPPVCLNSTNAGSFDGYPINPSLDSSGNIYVCDEGNEYVNKFNSSGSYLQRFYMEASVSPSACTMAVPDSSGSVWVTDSYNRQLKKFNMSGSLLLTVGTPPSGTLTSVNASNGNFAAPAMLTIDFNGNIWVSDGGNNRIEEFNPSGSWLMTIPSSGCTGTTPPACPAGTASGQLDFSDSGGWGTGITIIQGR